MHHKRSCEPPVRQHTAWLHSMQLEFCICNRLCQQSITTPLHALHGTRASIGQQMMAVHNYAVQATCQRRLAHPVS